MTGHYSREALRARLGPEVYAIAEEAARTAPTPTPEVIEAVRRAFAPALEQLVAEARMRPLEHAA